MMSAAVIAQFALAFLLLTTAGSAEAKLIESNRSQSGIPSGALDQRPDYVADRRLQGSRSDCRFL
jgi:hypothetical protein